MRQTGVRPTRERTLDTDLEARIAELEAEVETLRERRDTAMAAVRRRGTLERALAQHRRALATGATAEVRAAYDHVDRSVARLQVVLGHADVVAGDLASLAAYDIRPEERPAGTALVTTLAEVERLRRRLFDDAQIAPLLDLTAGR